MRLFIFFVSAIILLNSCTDRKTDTLSQWNKENENRDSWQKPSLVLNQLGNIEGKVIGDIGAGTGYFTFRMAIKKAKVIALEIDPVMIELVEAFKENLPEDIKPLIETRLVKEDNPALKPEELDIAVLINTITYIKNPVEYLQKLISGIKAGGKILIVDFKMERLPIPSPPKSERMQPETLVEYLIKAGYINTIIDNKTLDYQYLIIAEKPLEN